MQVLEKNGSSGRTRTYKPPVNRAISMYPPNNSERNQIENIEKREWLSCSVLS